MNYQERNNGGNTQQPRSMSVYQNDLVSDQNREPRKIGSRGGSSGVGADLKNISKIQKEMRTNSAAANIIDSDLLNLTAQPGSINGGMNGLNFNNQNQILFGGNSVNHPLSGGARISGISGEESVQTAPTGMTYSNALVQNKIYNPQKNNLMNTNFQD